MNKQILKRIDEVLKGNRGTQNTFVALAILLFCCGISGIVYAICVNQPIWFLPPAFTTFFLKYPVEKILKLRDKNIALATVPALISTLPPEEASKEIQKLIEQLYGKEQ